MLSLGAIGFLNPWLLAGLAALPVLWWLLRAIPPSPKTEVFAGVRLLLGLEDPERQASKTPWWLLLLRALAVAAILIGFAQPVLNPDRRLDAGDGPVLVLVDQGWASAPDWAARVDYAKATLAEAGQSDRPVMLWLAASGQVPPVEAPATARGTLDSARPAPWAPDHAAVLRALQTVPKPGQTVWLHDGLAGPGTADLAAWLAANGPLRLVGPTQPPRALTPPRLEEGEMVADILRPGSGGSDTAAVLGMAGTPDATPTAPPGERRVAVATARFAPGAGSATARFDMPPELVGQISRIALGDRASAGGAALADAAIRRVPVAIVDPHAETEVASLTSPRHYLREALGPGSEIREGTLTEVLAGDPAAIFLADQGDFTDTDRADLTAWVQGGGLLVRFSGPRLAAAVGEAGFNTSADDPLLPVRLRRGGRVLGGALAWGAPRSLGPFDPSGPFRRLTPPADVAVKTQVLAEPAPDLAGRVWASLDDGTPMVTAARRGQGHVVLFHVTADAEWSSLPLSGLYIDMLQALLALAPGRLPTAPTAEELAGTLWRPTLMLGPDGVPTRAPDTAAPVPGEALVPGRAAPGLAPGLYTRADGGARAAGAAESLVLNLFGTGDSLAPFPPAPAGATSESLGGTAATALGPGLIALALALLLIDTIATLALGGRLSGRARTSALLLALALTPQPGRADDARAVQATAETTLGYVLTGDTQVDRISERGLVGLGGALTDRTAVEPGPPVGVNPETDELAFFPVLYWPLLGSALPSDLALQRLAKYLAGGGMLLIDTQNGRSGFGSASGAQMRQIARTLNLPPLAPVDGDHVLTRSFYLLSSFPGRWRGEPVWAETAPQARTQRPEDADLPQFDRVDDNVSPVVVGSADWAAAWAVDNQGFALFPIGRPGDQQREMALRFGINLVMYALTGNYKSDQVHAPAVLQRLGQ